jgi:hypothetical protein
MANEDVLAELEMLRSIFCAASEIKLLEVSADVVEFELCLQVGSIGTHRVVL